MMKRFTLIELLVVLTLISTFMLLSLTIINKARKQIENQSQKNGEVYNELLNQN